MNTAILYNFPFIKFASLPSDSEKKTKKREKENFDSSQTQSNKRTQKMANNHNKHSNDTGNGSDSESSPLLTNRHVAAEAEDEKKSNVDGKTDGVKVPPAEKSQAPASGAYDWTANGLPLGHGSVMGEPMGRSQWDSSLFACLGRNDEFCSSDLEVCESFIIIIFFNFIWSIL